jgi:hypothetical protein
MPDTTPPTLNKLTFPTKIDLSSGSVWAEFAATTFDSESGVGWVRINFDKSIQISTQGGTTDSRSFLNIVNPWNNEGSRIIPYQILDKNFNQTINITSVVINDIAGNIVTYSPQELTAKGIATSVEIYGSKFNMPDTTPPTIGIEANKVVLKAGDSSVLTFTLNEASTNFVAPDVNVTGGTLSNFIGSGTTYTALFTPTANSNANGTVSVASGVFTDTAGNLNADGSDANNLLAFAVDTLLPTIAVSSNKSSLQSGDSATLTFTLSEASKSFVGDDVVVSGGTLSNFAGSGSSYTATFTLFSNTALNGTISVANGAFTDVAGNKNADGSDANNSVSFARIPTITNEIRTLSVIVDKNILGASATLLKELKESITLTNGAITKHIVEYSGLTFDYSQIDSLITTVTRDGEFTAEFTQEINDYLGSELNITYSAAVAIVGAASIDGIILSVAGADGNFVG